MQLVSFEIPCQTGAHRRVGVQTEIGIVDVTAALGTELVDDTPIGSGPVENRVAPSTMLEFLRIGERAMKAAKTCVNALVSGEVAAGEDGSQLVYDRSAVTLLSPLLRPNSIRDCTVYEQHLLNTRDIEQGDLPDAYYKYPVYYKGNPDAIVHPDEDVAWPTYTDKFDFELEIAAVIGKRGRDIAAADADQYIAGYTIFNDFSARDVQAEAKPVMMGPSKSKDFANGFGPCIVTTDSIGPTDLGTIVRVNGEVWSESSTDGMYHSWGEIIEHISEGITIHPGDVIGSGTVPGGCGLEFNRWLQGGDTLELEVEEIGTLRHQIVGSK